MAATWRDLYAFGLSSEEVYAVLFLTLWLAE